MINGIPSTDKETNCFLRGQHDEMEVVATSGLFLPTETQKPLSASEQDQNKCR